MSSSENNSNKLSEYRDQIEALNAISSYEVYRWLISLGKKLTSDPLSKKNRIQKNRVTQCQSELYVGLENDQFKAWSNTPITSGYAYLLTDIFNQSSKDTVATITPESIEELGLHNLFSMIRKAGFYQMIDMLHEQSVNPDHPKID